MTEEQAVFTTTDEDYYVEDDAYGLGMLESKVLTPRMHDQSKIVVGLEMQN